MEIKRKLTTFFWSFLFLAILLQLVASKQVPFGLALLYTSLVVSTFGLYFACVSRPAARQLAGRVSTAARLLGLLAAAVGLTLVLAGQGYGLVRAWLPGAAARELLQDPLPIFFGLFTLSSFVCCLHYLFGKYQQALGQEKALEVLQRQALEMEMHLLRHQLSPHFTFNVLNNLHFLIYKDQQEALHLLATYSKLLRYYAYESRRKTIPLRRETAFLEAYFELQRKQRPAELQLAFDTSGPPDNTFCITPFVLATFVENAFKHVQPNAAGAYYVRQAQQLTPAGQLTFALRNTCPAEAEAPGEYGGLGLQHARQSLALAYPGTHRLSVRREAGVFSVHLELTLLPCYDA